MLITDDLPELCANLVALIVVDIDALQLEVHQVLISTSVLSIWLDAMLITDDLPELCANLVSALTGLEVDNFPHIVGYLSDIYTKLLSTRSFGNSEILLLVS